MEQVKKVVFHFQPTLLFSASTKLDKWYQYVKVSEKLHFENVYKKFKLSTTVCIIRYDRTSMYMSGTVYVHKGQILMITSLLDTVLM